jgi:predicted ATPase
MFRGWSLAEQGRAEEGIAQVRQGMVAFRATGAEVFLPYFLVLLAESYGERGQAEEGLKALAEALDLVEKTGERRWEAETYRLKGQLTLQKFQVSSFKLNKVQGPKSSKTISQRLTPNSHAEAEGYFLKAIEVAQRQQAKSLELRATVSFARLWQSRSKQRVAHHMLAEVYGWFTEGFDTKDLQEAKALLEELS